MIAHGTVVGDVSRTHSPCGACGVLVEVVEGCRHLPVGRPASTRSRRIVERERKSATLDNRADLLAALGYPRP